MCDYKNGDVCGDNRFEIIAKAKEAILQSTNINTSPKEMEVLDTFLFRCWQMGWLVRYDNKKDDLSLKLKDEIRYASQRYAISDDCYAHKADQVPDFEDIEWAFQTGAEWALKNLTL